MSILTKVFVVLLVVFSIAFTVMTVSIVAQSTDWRDTALKYEEHAKIADTNLSNLIAANAAELAAAHDALRGHLDRIADLETQLHKARNDVGRVQGELARAASERSSSAAINRGLLAQLDACAAGRDGYHGQVEKLEARNIELERKNIDLNDRVNEYTAQIVVMLEQKRQLEQQVNIVRSENEKLTRQSRRLSRGMPFEDAMGAATGKVTAGSPVAETAIRGHVVEVAGNIVTISVGAADGVEKDMVFVIHRDDQYVGDLKIDLVDPNESAGRLESSTVSPRSGDLVTDAARIGGLHG